MASYFTCEQLATDRGHFEARVFEQVTFKGVKSFKTYAQELEQLPRRKLKASCDVLRIAV